MLKSRLSKYNFSTSSFHKVNRKKVVILGSGWASFRFARGLDQNIFESTIISPRNHFIFTPLLASTTVGTLEFRACIEPTRYVCSNYIQAHCTNIFPDTKSIECFDFFHNTPFKVDYDYLVIGVGAVPNTFNIPGVKEHTFFLRQIKDARNIRQRIISCFESASSPHCTAEERKKLLHFVVVGGGPTSIEFASELYDFLTSYYFKKWYPKILLSEVNITLLEASDHILGMFERNLSDYTTSNFRSRKIGIKTSVKVQEVQNGKIILLNSNQEKEEISFGCCVWSTGNTPCELVEKVNLPKHKSGRLLVDDHLRVKDHIFAFGDCATSNEYNYPQTAQCAQQEGAYLAKVFKQIQRGNSVQGTEAFKYNHIGIMSYIGGYKAILDVNNIHGKGFFAWFLWRSAYLTRLVSIRNKILVPMYWFKAFVFGRDISTF